MSRKVGSQSWCWMIVVAHGAGLDLAGPAHHQRNAEGAFPVGVLLAAERRHAAVGPAVAVRPVVGRVLHERVFGDAELVEQIEHLAHVLVVVDHRVVVRRLPAPGLAEALLLGVREEVHVRRVEPHEPRLAGLFLPLDEVLGGGDELVVAGLHALLGERAGVLDLLLADLAPARHHLRVVLVGGPAMEHAARPEVLLELRILGVVRPSPALPRRSGGTGCRRTRRSRGSSAACGSGRRGGSCRIARWRSPAP